MARIAVVSSHPPFTEGGHLVIGRSLVAALRDAGHEAELVLTPQNRFGRQAAAYAATWLTDLEESDGRRVDQVVSLRFPAYAVRHPRQVCWLNHTMREYYDQWPAFAAALSGPGRLKERVRRAIVHAADRRLLGPSRLARLFAQSRTIAARLQGHLGLAAEVLYPPPPPRQYRTEGFGDYVFAVSRLTPLKRIDLLVRALAEPAGHGLRAVVAGDGERAQDLRQLARGLGVEGRVSFLGHVESDVLAAHYAACGAVCFAPRGEDYGFVTVEAFASGKPVVTCTDSGGPVELVEPGVTGLVADPTPASLASALARLLEDRDLAARMGAEAARRATQLTWPGTVGRLVVV